MRDIVANKRSWIKQDRVKVVTVPFFKGLKIESMLEFAQDHPMVVMTLPLVQREIDRLPRDYIANVINTIVGKPFQDWINRKVEERNQKVAQEQDQIEMDQSIAEYFQASHATSGRYSNCFLDQHF